MPTSKPMFVMVTAATCGHCQNLHKRWAPIRKAIQSLNKVRITEIKLPAMDSKIADQGYPADLQRYVTWFPTALLFPCDNWDNVVARRDTKLDGIIMNGIVGNPYPQGSEYGLTEEGITRWINNSLATPKFSADLLPSASPADPRSHDTRSRHDTLNHNAHKRYIPTSGSAEICRKLNLKPKNR